MTAYLFPHGLRVLLAVALAVLPVAAHGDPEADAEIKRIEASLNRIHQEQASVHQQFQMVQELRRTELSLPDPFAPQSQVGIAPPPQDYNELLRLRERREQRIRELGIEIERLYGRYRELEAQKAPLLERMSELGRVR